MAKLDDLIEATERQVELLRFAIAIRTPTERDCARLKRLVASGETRLKDMEAERKRLLGQP